MSCAVSAITYLYIGQQAGKVMVLCGRDPADDEKILKEESR